MPLKWRSQTAYGEHKVQQALAKKTDAVGHFIAEFKGTPFENLHKRFRKVASRNVLWDVLWRIHERRDKWVRPLDEWS